MPSGLHIVSDGLLGHQTRVLYARKLDGDDWFTDPEPIDLSDAFTGADIHINVGDVNKAELRAFVTLSVLAETKLGWRNLKRWRRTKGVRA